MPEPENHPPPGLVDMHGRPWVDPTPNVIALSKATEKRQDDLRMSDKELFSAQLGCLREIASLRAEYSRQLGEAESRRVNEQLELRDAHQKELSRAEGSRIDAIRSVDVQAVQTASTRSSEQAATLVAQVASTAEAARNQVATMAAQVTTNFQQVTTELSQRLRVLEQISSQSVGKSAISDPAMERLQAAVTALTAIASSGQGKEAGFNQAWAIVAGAAVMAIAIFFGFYSHGVVTAPTPAAVSYGAPTVVSPAVIPVQPPK